MVLKQVSRNKILLDFCCFYIRVNLVDSEDYYLEFGNSHYLFSKSDVCVLERHSNAFRGVFQGIKYEI